MIALLLALAGAAPPEVRFVDASIDLTDELLDHRFVDVDQDGRTELCLAVRVADGTRELRVHELEATRVAPTPRHVIPVMEDVLAYGFADVREEAGLEIVFLTKAGAWSCSTQGRGLRGNIRRLVEMELVYDVPDPRALAGWRYFLDGDEGQQLLLPARDGFALFGPADGAPPEDPRAPTYRRRASFDEAYRERRSMLEEVSSESTTVNVGSGGIEITQEGILDIGFLLGEEGSRSSLLASDELSFRAPALADVDGDGRQDLVLWAEDGLRVHLAGPDGISPEPDRVEVLPPYLKPHDEPALRLVDLDGDGVRDVLAQLDGDEEGLDNTQIDLLVLLNDRRRLFPERPRQILRFEAAVVRASVVDVDVDGRPDLVVREFEMPDWVDTLTGLEFRLSHLVYRAVGEGGRLFERKPSVKSVQVFDEETVGGAVANRHIERDCDGDGVPDLVEVDLSGRIAIRRIRHESSFLGGDRWELERAPWKRFDVRGHVASLFVEDLNADGLADIVSRGGDSLTILLSVAENGRRDR